MGKKARGSLKERELVKEKEMSPEGGQGTRLCSDLEIQGKRKFKEDSVHSAIAEGGLDEQH